MSDDADRASELQEIYEADSLRDIQSAVAKIPVGTAGECDVCGEQSPRLVPRPYKGDTVHACAKCRDLYKLG